MWWTSRARQGYKTRKNSEMFKAKHLFEDWQKMMAHILLFLQSPSFQDVETGGFLYFPSCFLSIFWLREVVFLSWQVLLDPSASPQPFPLTFIWLHVYLKSISSRSITPEISLITTGKCSRQEFIWQYPKLREIFHPCVCSWKISLLDEWELQNEKELK